MSQTITKEKIKAHLNVVRALAEAIRELGAIPSGHLYAQVMRYMTLEVYDSMILALKRTGMVKEENHLLTWTGPDQE